MNFVSARRDHRHLAMGSALIALAFVAVLAFAARAQAAETLYWDNYDANTISFANIDGSGGGPVNLAGATLQEPEGIAYDTATNRLYIASSSEGVSNGTIVFVNLDGSGAGVFTAPGAPIENPEGIAIDPANRTLYWVNTKEGANSIGWARLDGSAGGTLNTTGVTVENPYRIAVDPVNGRVYWGNGTSPFGIAFANADNSGGGGTLDLSGATAPLNIRGIVADPAGGRLYWMTSKGISYASLTGGGGGDVDLTGATFNGPYGLALDPSLARLYWGNYNNEKEAVGAIGFASTAGGGGGITPSVGVSGPQDPVVLKSPIGTAAPAVTRAPGSRSTLNCSTGGWAADYAGSFVYEAPRSYAYQWTRNGKPISGATGAALSAKSSGSYACVVTAVNQAGSAAQSSVAVKVKAAKLKLSTKGKAKAKPGQVVKFKLKATNQGDIKTGNAKVCVKLPGSAKGELKAPKCKSLGKLKGHAKKSATLKIRVLPSAGGTYKVKFQVKGAPGKAAKAKIIVS